MGIEQVGLDATRMFTVAMQWVDVALVLGAACFIGMLLSASRK